MVPNLARIPVRTPPFPNKAAASQPLILLCVCTIPSLWRYATVFNVHQPLGPLIEATLRLMSSLHDQRLSVCAEMSELPTIFNLTALVKYWSEFLEEHNEDHKPRSRFLRSNKTLPFTNTTIIILCLCCYRG